ncbi:MAG TPA: helix-turn-helix domain-containing protein [Bryobacteraceae bacterium]|nr:helix-turn-helix domain-containing protein [Bryobacteraceae bacterium]
MARGKATNGEDEGAVLGALLAGQGVSETAKAYNLSESTVRSIRDRAKREGKFAEVRDKKDGGITEGKIVRYLHASLDALAVQAEVASDPEYLKGFPPQQLAVLYGVMSDKSIRLIEALSSADAAAGKSHDSIDADPASTD